MCSAENCNAVRQACSCVTILTQEHALPVQRAVRSRASRRPRYGAQRAEAAVPQADVEAPVITALRAVSSSTAAGGSGSALFASVQWGIP